MRFCKSRMLLSGYLLIIAHASWSQSPNDFFSPLSSTSYVHQISVMKGRSIPVMYSDKKEQKTYEGIIKSRNESLIDDFEKDRIIVDSILLNKSKAIIQTIRAKNTEFSFDSIRVYINRSPVANASCFGEGTLFINLGLFLWTDNDDELALVIGHELSHQFLNHSESKIKKHIAFFSSDEYIDEMKAIKKSTNGKYERFKNLMKDMVTESGKHSRYKESDADSLGVILIRNAGYNVETAANILLKLNMTDDLFISPGIYNLKSFFDKSGVDDFILQKNKKYNGLSMANVTMNADKDFDSIRTHPDCILRYKTVTGRSDLQETACCKQLNTAAFQLKERALIEMIRYAYESQRYTLCIHLCLFALNNNYKSPLYNTFLSLSFSGINLADKKLERFSVTDMKANPGSTLKELQDFIFNTNSSNISKLAFYFLNNIGSKTSDDYSIAEAMYKMSLNGADIESVQKQFKSRFPNSKYNSLTK